MPTASFFGLPGGLCSKIWVIARRKHAASVIEPIIYKKKNAAFTDADGGSYIRMVISPIKLMYLSLRLSNLNNDLTLFEIIQEGEPRYTRMV